MEGEKMSLILKGIDMPKEGEKITLAIFHDGDIVSYKYWLPKDAEAIQIPKGHGRLIDADELVKHLRKDPLFDLVERYGISGVIESRPTILDKERE